MLTHGRPRIAMWGGASLSNVGDRMLFDVVERQLARRLPGAVFTRYCPWAGDGGQVQPLWVDSRGRWPGSGASDAIVIVGGVFGGPPFANVIMRAFTLGAAPGAFDPDVVAAWLGVGIDDGVPASMKPEWSRYLKAFAGRMDFCTVRTPTAAERFRQAGAQVPGLVPDPSFALPRRPDTPAPPSRRRLRVGVAIGEATASARLRDTITGKNAILRCVRAGGMDLAALLDSAESVGQHLAEAEAERKRGFSVRLIAELAELRRSCSVEFIGVDNMYDDAAASDAFASALGGVPLRRVRAVTAAALRGVLSRYDLVVVSRFHSVVVALQAGVPFIAADPYWQPGTGTSKVQQLLAVLDCSGRHWTGAPSGPALTDLAGPALADAAGDRDRYARQHARAHAALDELAVAITAGPGQGSQPAS